MQITVVRHTSVDVPTGICYGITDVPLASTFSEELIQVRQNLGSATFDFVYSSPLIRCRTLASEIVPHQTIRTDNRLTELNFGSWEMSEWNTLFESSEGKEWFADYINTQCPGGESFSDLIHRTHLFLDDLRLTTFNRALIFTHAGIIRAMMCLLQNKTPQEAFRSSLEYGQIITFNLNDNER
jgi:alpha-ribazole phosphatase